MDTTETKADAYRRLIDEGRWEKASVYRVEQQHAFRIMGKSADEARAISWFDMIAHFPPTEETLARIQKLAEEKAAKQAAKQAAKSQSVDQASALSLDPAKKTFVDIDDELRGDPEDPDSILGGELDELQSRTKDKEIDYEGDMLWAYHNMGNRQARPKDAPSYGAWSQLDYAKKNRRQFMEAANRTLGKRVVEDRKSKQDDSMEQEEMLVAFEKALAEQA